MDNAIGSSVYNFIELVGTSSKGWEEAVSDAIDSADGKLTNMRIAEVVEMDAKLVEGKIVQFRDQGQALFQARGRAGDTLNYWEILFMKTIIKRNGEILYGRTVNTRRIS